MRHVVILAFVAIACALPLGQMSEAQTTYSYTFKTFNFPGAAETHPFGINNANEIVGYYVDASGTHGFWYDGDSTYEAIDVPLAGVHLTEALSINDSRKITGFYQDAAGTHGFLYEKDNDNYDHFDYPGASHTFPWGINNSDEVVGRFDKYGFLKVDSTYTPVSFPGAGATDARGINDTGKIVGNYRYNGSYIYDRLEDEYTPIVVPGSSKKAVTGINNNNHIVGLYDDAGGQTHGFLFDGTTYVTIDVPGVSKTLARDINDAGNITGRYMDALGWRGFVAVREVNLPPVVADALAGAGIDPEDVPPDVLDALIAAAEQDLLTAVSQNDTVNQNLSLQPNEVVVLGTGSVINGNVEGGPDNTVLIGGNSTVDGNIIGVGMTFMSGGNVEITGDTEVDVNEILVSSGAEVHFYGNVMAVGLVIEESGSATINGNLQLSGRLEMGPYASLEEGGNLICDAGATASIDPTATITICGNNECAALPLEYPCPE